MDLGHRHGDEWRWDPDRHRVAVLYSISVIDPAEVPVAREDAKKVPFGFSVREPQTESSEIKEDDGGWIDWLEVCG